MFQTKHFSDRADAFNRMRKKAKEIYGIDLPASQPLSRAQISLNKRHVSFKSNKSYDVWQTEIKTPKDMVLLCDISTGNVELIDASHINA